MVICLLSTCWKIRSRRSGILPVSTFTTFSKAQPGSDKKNLGIQKTFLFIYLFFCREKIYSGFQDTQGQRRVMERGIKLGNSLFLFFFSFNRLIKLRCPKRFTQTQGAVVISNVWLGTWQDTTFFDFLWEKKWYRSYVSLPHRNINSLNDLPHFPSYY